MATSVPGRGGRAASFACPSRPSRTILATGPVSRRPRCRWPVMGSIHDAHRRSSRPDSGSAARTAAAGALRADRRTAAGDRAPAAGGCGCWPAPAPASRSRWWRPSPNGSGRGVPAEQILVLTFSRRAAAELTARITARLGITTREPLVRTLHGYAYSLLRAQAVRAGEPSPRLLAAGESDQMVRELLAGQRESGRGGWPDAVSGALGSPAFAAELRDLMLRTAERGITPRRLAESGPPPAAPRMAGRRPFRAGVSGRLRPPAGHQRARGRAGPGGAHPGRARSAVRRHVAGGRAVAGPADLRRRVPGRRSRAGPAGRAACLRRGRVGGVRRSGPIDLRLPRVGPGRAAGHRGRPDGVASPMSRRLAPAVLLATRRIAERLPGASPHRMLSPAPVTEPAALSGTPGPASDGLPADGEVLVRTLADGGPRGGVHRRRVAPGPPAGGGPVVADGGAGSIAGGRAARAASGVRHGGGAVGRLRAGHGVDRGPGRRRRC